MEDANIPQAIKDAGFDFDWDEKKVWALDVPSEWVPIGELSWHFDLPFLGDDYALTPRQVLDNPGEHGAEYYRTMQADLIHPIDVMENKGRLLILDGLHRLMKASKEGHDKVAVRKIPRSRIPEILK
jgi:hypothetical protein